MVYYSSVKAMKGQSPLSHYTVNTVSTGKQSGTFETTDWFGLRQ